MVSDSRTIIVVAGPDHRSSSSRVQVRAERWSRAGAARGRQAGGGRRAARGREEGGSVGAPGRRSAFGVKREASGVRPSSQGGPERGARGLAGGRRRFQG